MATLLPDCLRAVRELKGFRHVVRHAYDVEFNETGLKELALGLQLAAELPEGSGNFGTRTRAEQGWE